MPHMAHNGPYGPYGLRGPKRGQKGVQNVVPKIGVSAGVMGEILGFNRGIGVLGPQKGVFLTPFWGHFWTPFLTTFGPKPRSPRSTWLRTCPRNGPKSGQKGSKMTLFGVPNTRFLTTFGQFDRTSCRLADPKKGHFCTLKRSFLIILTTF